MTKPTTFTKPHVDVTLTLDKLARKADKYLRGHNRKHPDSAINLHQAQDTVARQHGFKNYHDAAVKLRATRPAGVSMAPAQLDHVIERLDAFGKTLDNVAKMLNLGYVVDVDKQVPVLETLRDDVRQLAGELKASKSGQSVGVDEPRLEIVSGPARPDRGIENVLEAMGLDPVVVTRPDGTSFVVGKADSGVTVSSILKDAARLDHPDFENFLATPRQGSDEKAPLISDGLNGLFLAEIANERHGGVSPSTLASALDSLKQMDDDVLKDLNPECREAMPTTAELKLEIEALMVKHGKNYDLGLLVRWRS